MTAILRPDNRRFAVSGFLCLLLLCYFAERNVAQAPATSHDDVVSLKTWKQGTRQLAARVIDVRLTGSSQYEWDLFTTESKDAAFRLRLRPVSYTTLQNVTLSCWAAEVREIISKDASGAATIGPRLLNTQGPGIGDNFPREDWASYLCPVAYPNRVMDGPLYSIRAPRKFLIESFALELRVLNYRLGKHWNFDELQIRINVSNP